MASILPLYSAVAETTIAYCLDILITKSECKRLDSEYNPTQTFVDVLLIGIILLYSHILLIG